MVEMEAVLPGDTVDTSSESAEREVVRQIFEITFITSCILIYANLQVLGAAVGGMGVLIWKTFFSLIWKTGDAR